MVFSDFHHGSPSGYHTFVDFIDAFLVGGLTLPQIYNRNVGLSTNSDFNNDQYIVWTFDLGDLEILWYSLCSTGVDLIEIKISVKS